MTRVASKAHGAIAAARVDLAHDPLPDQFRFPTLFDHADEFVPDGPLESGIASDYLYIRVADAALCNADEGLATGSRPGDLVQPEPPAHESQCLHSQQ